MIMRKILSLLIALVIQPVYLYLLFEKKIPHYYFLDIFLISFPILMLFFCFGRSSRLNGLSYFATTVIASLVHLFSILILLRFGVRGDIGGFQGAVLYSLIVFLICGVVSSAFIYFQYRLNFFS